MEYLSLKDVTVLVTGGSSGIGRGLALGFARAGASVLATSNDREGLLAVQQEASRGDLRLTTWQADVRHREEVERLFAVAERENGLDVIVHCAGITIAKTLTGTTMDEYRDIVETNISGTFYCLQQGALRMKAQGRGGSIIVISSINAHWPLATQAVYTATKAAIESMAQSLAVEVATDNIRVNALAPGAIDTPMNRDLWPENRRDAVARRIPLGRVGTPHDLLGAALFLASPWAAYVTGATLVVDGGFMRSR